MLDAVNDSIYIGSHAHDLIFMDSLDLDWLICWCEDLVVILLSTYRGDDVGGLSGLLTEWKKLLVWCALCWVPYFVVIAFDSCGIRSI